MTQNIEERQMKKQICQTPIPSKEAWEQSCS